MCVHRNKTITWLVFSSCLLFFFLPWTWSFESILCFCFRSFSKVKVKTLRPHVHESMLNETTSNWSSFIHLILHWVIFRYKQNLCCRREAFNLNVFTKQPQKRTYLSTASDFNDSFWVKSWFCFGWGLVQIPRHVIVRVGEPPVNMIAGDPDKSLPFFLSVVLHGNYCGLHQTHSLYSSSTECGMWWNILDKSAPTAEIS